MLPIIAEYNYSHPIPDDYRLLVIGLADHEVTSDTRHARDLIRALYCLDCVGGALHLVLDDGNIEDSSVAVCEHAISSPDRDEVSPSQIAIERELIGILQRMSVADRGILLGVDPDEDDAEDVG